MIDNKSTFVQICDLDHRLVRFVRETYQETYIVVIISRKKKQSQLEAFEVQNLDDVISSKMTDAVKSDSTL